MRWTKSVTPRITVAQPHGNTPAAVSKTNAPRALVHIGGSGEGFGMALVSKVQGYRYANRNDRITLHFSPARTSVKRKSRPDMRAVPVRLCACEARVVMA